MENLYDVDAENFLLGTLIASKGNTQSYELVLEALRDDYFYDARNRAIFFAIRDLYDQKIQVDVVVAYDYIKSNGLINTITTDHWLNVVASCSTQSYLKSYVDIVVEKYKRRKLSIVLQEGIKMCSDGSFDISSIVSFVEKNTGVLPYSSTIKPYASLSKILSEEMPKLNEARKKPDLFSGINSGYIGIDAKANGFSAGQMIVIAARAGIGKTAFAVDLAKNFCIQEKKTVGFISLEMPAKEIAFRFVSSYAHVNGKKLKKPWLLTKEELGRLNTLIDELKDIKFFVQESSGLTMSEIRNEARKMKRQENIDALFIDYLGMVKCDSSKLPRWEKMQDVSADMKRLARELEIPVFVLNQLNRDAEGKVPTLANLRETGAVEQDADMVFILHRDRNPEDGKRGIPTMVKLEKNRNGESGDTEVLFMPEYASFVDIDPQYRKE